MEYVDQVELVQNDYGYDLEFQVTDVSGQPVPLEGASIMLFVAEAGSSKAKVVGSCQVTDAPNGKCKYTVQEGDFDEGNKVYLAELEITYSGMVITARGLKIKVVPELPESK